MTSSGKIILSDLAHGRSGDKGNHANIAVIAYTPTGYSWLEENLSIEVVQAYFRELEPSKVVRYEVPNILGLNFVLSDVLGGGASKSLRIDSQGKTLALALLQMQVEKPENYSAMLRPRKEIEHGR